jgi:hypothetical protein
MKNRNPRRSVDLLRFQPLKRKFKKRHRSSPGILPRKKPSRSRRGGCYLSSLPALCSFVFPVMEKRRKGKGRLQQELHINEARKRGLGAPLAEERKLTFLSCRPGHIFYLFKNPKKDRDNPEPLYWARLSKNHFLQPSREG